IGLVSAVGPSVISERLMAGVEDVGLNGRKPFCLYIHFGSMCGPSSGLVMPNRAGEWPIGYFASGEASGSVNPNLNQHYQEGSLIFHEYNKCLREIAQDVCLVNGTPV